MYEVLYMIKNTYNVWFSGRLQTVNESQFQYLTAFIASSKHFNSIFSFIFI